MKYYMGVDPGQAGGIAFVPVDGGEPMVFPIPETEHDTAEILREFGNQVTQAFLEKVHAMPKQGVSSTFKFGRAYGFIRGLLTALGIPYEDVTPQRWQKDMQCQTGGDKRISRAKAQQLFPAMAKQITHRTADALLIATWGRNYNRGFYGR